MSAHKPHDAQYAERALANFERQKMMHTLGARVIHTAPGEVQIEMPHNEAFTQQNGFIHAGVVTTLVDTACGYAAYTLMPADADVLSIEFKVNLMSPALGDRFVAIGKVAKAGRNITVCNGELHAFQGDAAKTVALMQATMMTIRS